MEFLNPQMLLRHESGAPALNRGIALLVLLGRQFPLSLEMLVGELRLPKASVFRLLGTLEKAGLIRKRPDRTYEPLWKFAPLEDEAVLFRQRIEQTLTDLCARSGCTAEWYEPGPDGMELVAQRHPDRELRVQAQPGFLRRWNDEYEAVARLGHAFAAGAPIPTGLTMYVANGVLEPISGENAARLGEDARRTRTAWDVHFNANGVRRFAAAAFCGTQFRGVLALAEAFHFKQERRPGRFVNLLTQTLATL